MDTVLAREALAQDVEMRLRAIPPSSPAFEYLLVHAISGLNPFAIGAKLGAGALEVRDTLAETCKALGLKFNLSLSPENRELVRKILQSIPEADEIAKGLVAKLNPPKPSGARAPEVLATQSEPAPLGVALQKAHQREKRMFAPPAGSRAAEAAESLARSVGNLLSFLDEKTRKLAAFVALGARNERIAELAGYKNAKSASVVKSGIWEKLGIPRRAPMERRVKILHAAFVRSRKVELETARRALDGDA